MSLKARHNETVYMKRVRSCLERAVALGTLCCTARQFAEWSDLGYTHNLRRRLHQLADDLEIELHQDAKVFGTQELVMIFPAYHDAEGKVECPF